MSMMVELAVVWLNGNVEAFDLNGERALHVDVPRGLPLVEDVIASAHETTKFELWIMGLDNPVKMSCEQWRRVATELRVVSTRRK